MRAPFAPRIRSVLLLVAALFLSPFLPGSSTTSAFAAPLPLDEYLSQVRSDNPGVRAADETSRGALLRSREARLVFAPQLSATAQVLSDARPQLNSFAPEKTTGSSFTFGLSQQFAFGAQARLGYQLSHVRLHVNPAATGFYNTTDYFDAIPSLELAVPLLRNFGGSESRAQQELVEAAALATHYGEAHHARMLLLEAELAYWRLAAGREVVEVQERTLSRTKFLREWAAKRVRFNLGDRSDLLQADAAHRFRELELQAARDEERAAEQGFNSIRGREPGAKVEPLAPLAQARAEIAPEWKTLSEPPRPREDLLASEQARRLSSGQAEQAAERNRANLELFGQAQLNGRSGTASDALSSGFSLDKRTASVGVRLVSSLNFGAKSDARDGAEREQAAASMAFERRRFEQKQEFLDLRSRLAEAQARLGLARELEKLQEEKVTHERNRLQRGRSTTFQLIQFEADYSTAQLARLRAQFEVIQLVARLNTFGAHP